MAPNNHATLRKRHRNVKEMPLGGGRRGAVEPGLPCEAGSPCRGSRCMAHDRASSYRRAVRAQSGRLVPEAARGADERTRRGGTSGPCAWGRDVRAVRMRFAFPVVGALQATANSATSNSRQATTSPETCLGAGQGRSNACDPRHRRTGAANGRKRRRFPFHEV